MSYCEPAYSRQTISRDEQAIVWIKLVYMSADMPLEHSFFVIGNFEDGSIGGERKIVLLRIISLGVKPHL
jgi:hypothetical protein